MINPDPREVAQLMAVLSTSEHEAVTRLRSLIDLRDPVSTSKILEAIAYLMSSDFIFDYSTAAGEQVQPAAPTLEITQPRNWTMYRLDAHIPNRVFEDFSQAQQALLAQALLQLKAVVKNQLPPVGWEAFCLALSGFEQGLSDESFVRELDFLSYAANRTTMTRLMLALQEMHERGWAPGYENRMNCHPLFAALRQLYPSTLERMLLFVEALLEGDLPDLEDPSKTDALPQVRRAHWRQLLDATHYVS